MPKYKVTYEIEGGYFPADPSTNSRAYIGANFRDYHLPPGATVEEIRPPVKTGWYSYTVGLRVTYWLSAERQEISILADHDATRSPRLVPSVHVWQWVEDRIADGSMTRIEGM